MYLRLGFLSKHSSMKIEANKKKNSMIFHAKFFFSWKICAKIFLSAQILLSTFSAIWVGLFKDGLIVLKKIWQEDKRKSWLLTTILVFIWFGPHLDNLIVFILLRAFAFLNIVVNLNWFFYYYHVCLLSEVFSKRFLSNRRTIWWLFGYFELMTREFCMFPQYFGIEQNSSISSKMWRLKNSLFLFSQLCMC